MAFASVEDLKLRYPDLASVDDKLIQVKLEDATAVITARLNRRGRKTCEMDAALLEMVCCNVAARVLYPNPFGSGLDVSQMSTTVGSISEQLTFSGSRAGNCRLLESDLIDLGLSGGRAGSAYLGRVRNAPK